MAPLIEVRNVTKTFDKNRIAVDDVSFSIEENALFGFVGPNGAGKTTTIRILTTLLKPNKGQVLVNGHSATDDPRAVRQLIGYMPDFFGTYTDLTVWEYLDFFSGCYDIPPRDRTVLVNDLLELVELGHRRDDFVDTLSRGMKQRLSLARTLVHDPKVLVLDEPASGLDPRARVEFRDLLTELHKMGKTIFFSSHILADIAEICSEVAIIEAGKMVVQGNIEAMQRRMHQNRRVRVRVLGDVVEAAQSILVTHQGVEQVDIEAVSTDDGSRDKLGGSSNNNHKESLDATGSEWEIVLQFRGDRWALSSLVKELVLADIPMVAFNEETDSLEDLFMQLTEGIVS